MREVASALPNLRSPPPPVADLREAFHRWRREKLATIETSIGAWNDAVATAVETVARQEGMVARTMGVAWHAQVAAALRAMDVPLHSDVILSTRQPHLRNSLVVGRMRACGACFLSEDPEFMPTTQYEWPRFPYFVVEPGTPTSLAREGLILLANPPGIEEEEPNVVGAPICRATYGRAPMIGLDLELQPLEHGRQGAVLLNWSFRGRLGAMAKIFVDGLAETPAFGVTSTDEDPTPNFWTVLPWREGRTVIDLKHVGAGFLLFEHCDVHSVTW